MASKLFKKHPKSVSKFGKHFVYRFYRSKGVKPNIFFAFSLGSQNKVLQYLNNLNVKKATGQDGITARYV